MPCRSHCSKRPMRRHGIMEISHSRWRSLHPERALDPGFWMHDALTFVEALIEQGTDFIGVLVNGFRSPPRRGSKTKERSRLYYVAEAVGRRGPVLATGAIYHVEDGQNALAADVNFITLGALIIEP